MGDTVCCRNTVKIDFARLCVRLYHEDECFEQVSRIETKNISYPLWNTFSLNTLVYKIIQRDRRRQSNCVVGTAPKFIAFICVF